MFCNEHCCLYCEAETFQAIHNSKIYLCVNLATVVYTAKQKLFKQFTTCVMTGRDINTVVYTAKQKLFKQFTTTVLRLINQTKLLFILRSRNFSSNSQLIILSSVLTAYCCLYCEAETFQAIHNTSLYPFPNHGLLFILRSRNFSSNSQRIW